MNGWTFAWILWLAMFAVIEGAALKNPAPGDTLSEHIWTWFSVKDKGTGWRARRITLALGLVALLFHFLNGGGWIIFD